MVLVSPASTSSSFSFGGTTQPTTPTFSFGGSSNTTTSSPASGFKFGNSTPSTTTTTTPSFNFGPSTTPSNNAFSINPTASITPQPVSEMDHSKAAIQAIADQINPEGQYDRFKCAFYNRVSSKDLAKYAKPAKMSENMWKDAQSRNPDKSNVVPVLACGFGDLKLRMEIQDKQRQSQEETLEKISKTVDELFQRKEMIEKKIADYRKVESRNITKIIRITAHLEILRRRGQSFNIGEENLFSTLQKIYEELQQPNQYQSKLSEIMSNARMRGFSETSQYPTLDEETIQQIQPILSDFVQVLSCLVQDLLTDSKEINIMEQSYRESLSKLNAEHKK